MKCSIISPSYIINNKEINLIEKNIKKLNFEIPELSKDFLFNRWAGSPKKRLVSFYQAWNSDSKIIFCTKGGSGTTHFSSLINKKNLKKKKIIMGYSDITMILNTIHKKKKIITFHGPNLTKKIDEKTENSLKSAIQMENYGLNFKDNLNNSSGKIKGRLIGGNLERFVELVGQIGLNLKNKVFFFEEVNLTEYKIYNLLTNLKNRKNFQPKAILFGNLGIKNKKLMKEMIKSLFPKIPIIMDLPFGHQIPNIVIPIGANCEIDFKEGKITFSFPRKHKKYAVKSP